MDAVRIEHLFSGALGTRIGQRGKPNDADYVRSGQPKYLVKALDGALDHLKKRASKLRADDDLKMLIEHAIDDLEMTKNSMARTIDKLSGPACHQLWSVSAVAVHLIDQYLKEQSG